MTIVNFLEPVSVATTTNMFLVNTTFQCVSLKMRYFDLSVLHKCGAICPCVSL